MIKFLGIVSKRGEFMGLSLPVGTVLIREDNSVLIFDKIPDYKGRRNLGLPCKLYDIDSKCLEFGYHTKEDSDVSRLVWSRLRKSKITPDCNDYSELMKHDRRHKKSAGQVEHPYTITDYSCSNDQFVNGGMRVIKKSTRKGSTFVYASRF